MRATGCALGVSGGGASACTPPLDFRNGGHT